MRTLIVQAHPVADSYNSALLAAVAEKHDDGRTIRLGQGGALEHESFVGVTHLIAVYPTWWGSVPAVLLAAMNDVLGPWVDGTAPAETNPLRLVQTVTVVTTHGSSKLVNVLQGEPGLQLWKRTIMPLCANGATFDWRSLYKLDRATDADRAEFIRTIG